MNFRAGEAGRVGVYDFDAYLKLISDFHSYPAPGLIVGGFMVELAKRHMPPGVLYDAISEAASCLPDAIQLLTPCTVGNGWLRIVNLDRYALCLFDKRSGAGVRVWLDVEKLSAWPRVRDWYLKRTTKQEQDSEALRAEMRAAGEGILSLRPVQVASQSIPVTLRVEPPRFAYVANSWSNNISQYSIGPDGSLTPLSPATVAAGTHPISVTVDPSGRFVYVANPGSNNISQYSIAPDGRLTPLNPATVAAGTNPNSVTVDPSGQYVYVADFNSHNIWQYSIGPDGSLTPLSPATVAAGRRPFSITTTGPRN